MSYGAAHSAARHDLHIFIINECNVIRRLAPLCTVGTAHATFNPTLRAKPIRPYNETARARLLTSFYDCCVAKKPSKQPVSGQETTGNNYLLPPFFA
jgi:hypothetical protein